MAPSLDEVATEYGLLAEAVLGRACSPVAAELFEVDLTELPVLDRNFTKFILLTPGAQQMGWQHAASENPQGSTPAVGQPAYQGGIKDQHYFAAGTLFEIGFGFNRYDLNQISRGVDPYFVGKPNPFMMRSALNTLELAASIAPATFGRVDRL